MLLLLSLVACMGITGGACPEVSALPSNQTIQAIGDSMFDFVGDCADAPDLAGIVLNEKVENNAVGGATMIDDIPEQYRAGSWEWVIVIGGGNDLECSDDESCMEILDEVKQTWRSLTDEITSDGAKVALVGYPEFPRENEEIGELWATLGDDYIAGMEAVADGNDDVYFVELRTVMDGNTSPGLFASDLLHPSRSGSEVMAEAIAGVISAN